MEKLITIQNELKAPKSQFNSFGKYNYRNAEDILEAAKPLLMVYKCLLYLSDEMIYVEGRHYVKATVTFVDVETNFTISVTASAREEQDKKGMDGSQITGASSSYARKYALNGLFLIDDTKDSDNTNTHDKEIKPTATVAPKQEKPVPPPAIVEFDKAKYEAEIAKITTKSELGKYWSENKAVHCKEFNDLLNAHNKKLTQ